MVMALLRTTTHPMVRGRGAPCRTIDDLPCRGINVLPAARANRELQKINIHSELSPIGLTPPVDRHESGCGRLANPRAGRACNPEYS
jgi:hypothetical protein